MSAASERQNAPAVGVTGIENSKLGMWWFLASEIMMFSGLIGSYLLMRSANPAMLEQAALLNKVLATINTLALVTSSATMAMGVGSIARGDVQKLKLFLALTILLGCLFLINKGIEYSQKFHHEIYPGTSLFFSFYFVLTGLHALHVFVGILLLLGTLVQAYRGKYSQIHHDTVENIGLYWHLVDVIWIFLFPLFYLV